MKRSDHKGSTMRKAVAALAVLLISVTGMIPVLAGGAADGAANQSAQGITATSIKVGITTPTSQPLGTSSTLIPATTWLRTPH